MCDTGNLIDLSGCDQPNNASEETVASEECVIVESTNFQGPYDPFDSIEKEACIKGLNKQDDQPKPKLKKNPDESAANRQLEYSDQDLNNETPPVAMDFEPTLDAIKACETQSLQKQVMHLNALRMSSLGTPSHNVNTKFSLSHAMLAENLQMLDAESPIKLIEDDSPVAAPEAGASTLSDETCSNVEFEARLKLLRIAMLKSPVKKHAATESNPRSHERVTTSVDDVGKLLQELHNLVRQHVDAVQRQQFETLIAAIGAAVQGIAALKRQPTACTKVQPSYKRQATFDLDLELQHLKTDECVDIVEGRKMQEFPDAMTCSSATFDGESLANDKVALPIIEVESQSQSQLLPQKPDSFVTELVNDNLAQQINELLEQHNLTKVQLNNITMQDNDKKTVGAPTVILVVNSAVGNQLSSCNAPSNTIIGTQQQQNANQTAANNSGKTNTCRRRSSSLSIHDKAKQERPKSMIKQSSSDSSSAAMPLKELSVVGDKFNAMPSYRQRRNSFTVGLNASKAAANASAMISQGRTLVSGRNKAPTINATNMKSLAKSDKVAIPIKRVAPMVKPSMLSTDVKHLNATMPRCPGQETPMSTRSTGLTGGTNLFCTSTPMPQMRRSLRPVSSSSNSQNVRSTGYAKKST